MNTYIASIIIKGKTGRTYGVPIIVKAKDKDAAEQQARELLEEDGFTIFGVDYIDWAD